MAKINTTRVITGGLLAGLVMNVIDGVVNTWLLGDKWMSASKALHIDTQKMHTMSGAGWVVTDFLAGIAVVWIYASIRPRFGKGPKTAMIAASTAWFISHLMMASYVFMGVYPMDLIVPVSVAGFIATVVGSWAGGWAYKEA